MTAVIETDAPDREKGVSIVALIIRMRSNFQLVYQVRPVVFQRLRERFGIPAGNVVLDRKGAPGFLGGSHDVLEHDIATCAAAPNRSHEALQQNAIQPV